MWHDYGYGWGGHPHLFHGPFSILLALLFIVLIVFTIRYFMRGRHHHDHRETKKSDSLTLLETRYVQGEIDRDEFLKKKSDLLDKSPPSA